MLERDPQRHQRVCNEERQLARNWSHSFDDSLAKRSRWSFAQSEHAVALRLVAEEQVADLLDQLVGVRQRRGDAEMAFREPVVRRVGHAAILRGLPGHHVQTRLLADPGN